MSNLHKELGIACGVALLTGSAIIYHFNNYNNPDYLFRKSYPEYKMGVHLNSDSIEDMRVQHIQSGLNTIHLSSPHGTMTFDSIPDSSMYKLINLDMNLPKDSIEKILKH